MDFEIQEFLEAKRLGLPFAGKPASPSTLRAYGTSFRLIESVLGKPVTEMRSEDVPTLFRALDEKGVSQTTKNHAITFTKTLFEWGIDNGIYKGRNPMKGVQSKMTEPKRHVLLSESDIDRFMRGLDKVFANNPAMREKYGVFFSLLYYGGLRINEAISLKTDAVYDDGIIVNGKGNRDRFVPLTAAVIRRLRAYVAKHEGNSYVFVNEARNGSGDDVSITTGHVYEIFRATRKAAGLPESVTPHTFRHAFGTKALSKTGNLALVQDLMGHASPVTTRIYARISKADAKRGYDSIFGDEKKSAAN